MNGLSGYQCPWNLCFNAFSISSPKILTRRRGSLLYRYEMTKFSATWISMCIFGIFDINWQSSVVLEIINFIFSLSLLLNCSRLSTQFNTLFFLFFFDCTYPKNFPVIFPNKNYKLFILVFIFLLFFSSFFSFFFFFTHSHTFLLSFSAIDGFFWKKENIHNNKLLFKFFFLLII